MFLQIDQRHQKASSSGYVGVPLLYSLHNTQVCRMMQDSLSMLEQNINYFKSKPVNIPKITILLDHGYHLDNLSSWLKQIYPQIMTKIRLELSNTPSIAEKQVTWKIRLRSRCCSVGCRSCRTLGWNGVKASSRTLREHLPMPLPRSIFASSD